MKGPQGAAPCQISLESALNILVADGDQEIMLEISVRQSPVSEQKNFRRSKFLETVATMATSHFSFYYYHFPKERGRKKTKLVNEKKM